GECGRWVVSGRVGSVWFFFQAEDGIRDWSVTGVQTCALPIFTCGMPSGRYVAVDLHRAGGIPQVMKILLANGVLHGDCMTITGRSEERRVGKEGRGRWSPYH